MKMINEDAKWEAKGKKFELVAGKSHYTSTENWKISLKIIYQRAALEKISKQLLCHGFCAARIVVVFFPPKSIARNFLIFFSCFPLQAVKKA